MTYNGREPGYVDPEYLRRLAEIVQPVKRHSYAAMALASGKRVLDVGCGPGADTVPMGEIVGPQGEVQGIDHDEEMVQQADQLARDKGVHAWVHHRQGDAAALPFEDQYFDACRSERLLQHLADPEKAVSEMVRVTRPGGMIVVTDTDHSSVSIANEMLEIEWKLRRVRADMLANGYSGRHLFGYFKRARLENISVEVFPLIVTDYALGRYLSIMDMVENVALQTGVLDAEQVAAFDSHLRDLDKEGQFLAYGIMLLAAGRKPLA